MKVFKNALRRIRLACIALVIFAISTGAAAQQPSIPAREMVRRAALYAERGALDTHSLYMYRLRKETNSGTAVREMIETKDVILARTLSWNGKEITPDERAKEDAKLESLIGSPEELRKKKNEQDSDRERTLRLVRALPDALLYEFDGAELIRGRETARLRFRPNPEFDPPSRETYGLKAAEGHLWIDKEQGRIARMDATLTDDVNIGWGLLGHINKGGRLQLEQTMLPDGNWRITTLNIDATGKAFIFKSIKIKQRQTGWDYRPVPSTLSIGQAVDLLKKQGTFVTQKNLAKP